MEAYPRKRQYWRSEFRMARFQNGRGVRLGKKFSSEQRRNLFKPRGKRESKLRGCGGCFRTVDGGILSAWGTGTGRDAEARRTSPIPHGGNVVRFSATESGPICDVAASVAPRRGFRAREGIRGRTSHAPH